MSSRRNSLQFQTIHEVPSSKYLLVVFSPLLPNNHPLRRVAASLRLQNISLFHSWIIFSSLFLVLIRSSRTSYVRNTPNVRSSQYPCRVNTPSASSERAWQLQLRCVLWPQGFVQTLSRLLSHTFQTKSAEYEKPRNSSCIACERTEHYVSITNILKVTLRAGLTRLNRSQHRRYTGKLRIKIARVRCACDHRLEGRLDPLVINVIPINIPEKRLTHDLLCIGWSAPKSHLRFACQKLLKNGDGVTWHVDRIKGLISKNRVVDFVFIFATERRLLKEHLVD